MADPMTPPSPGLPPCPAAGLPGVRMCAGRVPATEPPPPRRGKLWLPLGLVAAAAGGGYYYYDQQRQAALAIPTSPAASQTEPLSQGEFRLSDTEMRALRIEEMQSRAFRAERVAEGRIAYNEDRSTPVFTPYNGRVVRTVARLGDTLAAGGTLFEIETTDLAGAANDLLSAADAANKARGTLDQARREEARQNSLFSARATSQREVEQARVADRRRRRRPAQRRGDAGRGAGQAAGARPHAPTRSPGSSRPAWSMRWCRSPRRWAAPWCSAGSAPASGSAPAPPTRSSPSPTSPPSGWSPRCGSWTRR